MHDSCFSVSKLLWYMNNKTLECAVIKMVEMATYTGHINLSLIIFL